MDKIPDYNVLKNKNLREIALIIARREKLSFKELSLEVNVPPSTLQYRLHRLVNKSILEKLSRGRYTLAYKTPLGFLSSKTPKAYLGLLGLRQEHKEPEWITALNLLEREGFRINEVTIVATPEAVSSWSNHVTTRVNWRLCSSDDLFKPSKCIEILEPIIADIARKSALIVDITAGPRPAGVMLHKIASRYYVPQIYVREDTKKLYWIVSLKEILRNMGIMS